MASFVPHSLSPAGAAAPTVLFASTQHWNSVFQLGSHHIARCFAQRGWRVGFVSAPISPLHLAGYGDDVAARVASWRAGGSLDAASGVWHYVPFAPLPWGAAPIVRNRMWVRAAWGLCRPRLSSVLQQAGFDRPQLAYTDHFLHEGLLRPASPKLIVFRRADNLAGFPGAASDFPTREAAFARRSDITICTTESSLARMAAQGVHRALLIRNGIQLDRFFEQAPLPTEYSGNDRPIVVYVGSAEHRLDIDLVVRGLRELRQLRWVIIGPFEGAPRERLEAAGAQVLGSRPHHLLSGYLQHAHVGIVPFSFTRNSELIREVSPLKVLEYSACGLPVVGTQGCQYPAGLPTPLAVCGTGDAFLEAVKAFAEQPRPGRPSVAQFNDYAWSTRLEPLFAWLDSRGATVQHAPQTLQNA